MSKRYFQTKRADVPVEIDGYKFTFAKALWSDASKSYWGLLVTEDNKAAEVLKKQGSKFGVIELSEEDGKIMEQKKKNLRSPSHERPFSAMQLNPDAGPVTHVAPVSKVAEEDEGEIEAINLEDIIPDLPQEEEEGEEDEEEILGSIESEPGKEPEEEPKPEEKPKRKRGRPRKNQSKQ